MHNTIFMTSLNIYTVLLLSIANCSTLHLSNMQCGFAQNLFTKRQHKLLYIIHYTLETNEHLLGHSFSYSVGKQSGAFLLFLCGDMRWEELGSV